jgi:Recombination endonuclease VII
MTVLDTNLENIRELANLQRLPKDQDPVWVESERERKRKAIADKRKDPEFRAAQNARRRVLAQHPEARQKQAERMIEWKLKNSNHVAAYSKQWREENAEHVSQYAKNYMPEYVNKPEVRADIFRRNLWRNYKITTNEFNDLWKQQEGKCAICEIELVPRGRAKNSAAVDHNHENGAVRGLLCRMCNTGIGSLRDSPEILQSAAKYLVDRGSYCGKF